MPHILNEEISRRSFLVASATASLLMAEGSSAATDSSKYPRDLTRADIERWMTELSNWGRWGKDDQAGTVNLITPKKRKQAASLVKDGESFSMSLDADLPREGVAEWDPNHPMGGPGPRRATWAHQMKMNGLAMADKSGYAVDTYAMSFHGNDTTHLDALSHFIYNGHIYNGFPAESITEWGATKNDVMAYKNGFFTRGVLVDVPVLKNVAYMGDDEAIFPEDLEAWEKKSGLRIESGDAVLIRTGRRVRDKEKTPLNLNVKAPGLYASCGKWLKEKDIALLGSDCVQDVRPSRVEGVNQPIHQMFLVAVGTPLLDNCDLEAVSKAAQERKRWSFLLTVAPLCVPGGTGSPFNPIGTF